MRILGIDPGLLITGYGCVDLETEGREPSLVEAGVLRLKAGRSISFRLHQLDQDLTHLLEELKPQVMVVEQLFSHYRHVRTSILMGHARGVVLLAAQRRSIDIHEVLPTAVKKAVTGHGHASKEQIQLAIMAQFGLKELPQPPDVADAIAIAVTIARRLASERVPIST